MSCHHCINGWAIQYSDSGYPEHRPPRTENDYRDAIPCPECEQGETRARELSGDWETCDECGEVAVPTTGQAALQCVHCGHDHRVCCSCGEPGELLVTGQDCGGDDWFECAQCRAERRVA